MNRIKIRIARSNMSRMSVNDISRKPKIARYIPIYNNDAKIAI